MSRMADSVDHHIRALQRSIMDSRRRPVGTLTPGMLLARELIGYLSRQLVARLSPSTFETGDPAATAEVISQIIEEDRILRRLLEYRASGCEPSPGQPCRRVPPSEANQ